MGLRLNTNVGSLIAQRHLAQASHQLDGHFARLSSGLRITSPGDDAAGLMMSTRLSADVRATAQLQRNVTDGLSIIQTISGALGDMLSNLERMRELATQAVSGALNADDRAVLDAEFQELYDEIEQLQGTEFNGRNVVTGTTIAVQVGHEVGDTYTIVTPDTTHGNVTLIDILGVNLNTASGANDALVRVANATNWLNGRQGLMGANQNALQSIQNALSSSRVQEEQSLGRIQDVDYATELAKLTSAQVKQEAGISVLTQANSSPQTAVELLFG